jgi:hypothetical protein
VHNDPNQSIPPALTNCLPLVAVKRKVFTLKKFEWYSSVNVFYWLMLDWLISSNAYGICCFSVIANSFS